MLRDVNPYNYGKARSVGCDTTVTRIEGTILSPNYPLNYDNYIQCVYKIVKSSDDVCSIEVILSDFDVEDTPECTADYLDLGDGSGQIIWFPANGENIKFVFKSNHMNNKKGFVAKIKQLRNSCPPYVINRIPNIMHTSESKPEVFHKQPVYLGSYCDIYIGEVIGDLRSPGYPYGYHNNQSCHYSIRRAATDICKVELIFHQFDISSNDRRVCDSDFVELPDRSRNANTRKIIWFPANGDNIKFVFKSNHLNNKKGFVAKIKQLRNSCPPYVINRIPNIMHTSESKPEVFHKQPVYLGSYCDIYIGEVIGDLRSPGYPYGYHNNQSCHYSIRSLLAAQTLSLKQLEGLSSSLCGRLPIQQRVYPFSRSSDYLILKFNSDNIIDERVTGFWIEVRQLRNSCDQKTPQNVEPLDKNTCEYEIQFLNFNIESSRDYSGNCNKDFLQYPDGSRICGFSSARRTFQFPKFRDRIGMFYFSSDDNHEERGYEIRITQIPKSCFNNHNYGFAVKPSFITSTPTPYLTTSYTTVNNTYYTCDEIISSEIHVITSPNYPQNYPTITRCTCGRKRQFAAESHFSDLQVILITGLRFLQSERIELHFEGTDIGSGLPDGVLAVQEWLITAAIVVWAQNFGSGTEFVWNRVMVIAIVVQLSRLYLKTAVTDSGFLPKSTTIRSPFLRGLSLTNVETIVDEDEQICGKGLIALFAGYVPTFAYNYRIEWYLLYNWFADCVSNSVINDGMSTRVRNLFGSESKTRTSCLSIGIEY
ncbi:unnamed protein product [Medioppia subpectinata]|uniref:CUB domain-containing protein n=1 Tax=Medioppia subpectinata TaxID=1979941 RepID=A0A7R9Q2K4_9ACAR|nr:unnamed protein product [Medioppia subpectinata]CAG2110475.1 unnamed protein product [Medioppia subpectinata]